MAFLSPSLRDHSRTLSIIAAVSLIIVIVASYVLILLLFLDPSIYSLKSFRSPLASGISPSTAVSFVSTLFVAAISVLTTAAVEQNLWHKLSPRAVRKQLTVGEARRLAQWSISSLERFLYVFEGSSWILKITGLCLLGTIVVNPILVAGISQKTTQTVTTSYTPAELDKWDGYIDPANSAYHGGTWSDIPGQLAASAYLSNVSAPAAPVCPSDSSTARCSAMANVASLRATCRTGAKRWPLSVGPNTVDQVLTVTSRSQYNPEAESTLYTGSPRLYANFSSWITDGQTGGFAVIFGSWVNASDALEGPWTLSAVDCLVQFGTVNISQSGTNTPAIVSDTFVSGKNTTIPGTIFNLHGLYTRSDSNTSPYDFTGTITSDGADNLYRSPIGLPLIQIRGYSDAVTVGRRIEKSFEMATLMAFARSTRAADLSLERTTLDLHYDYDWRYLLALILPTLALLALWGRWRVHGADVMIGYDPIMIAQRGSVKGLGRWDNDDVQVRCVRSRSADDGVGSPIRFTTE